MLLVLLLTAGTLAGCLDQELQPADGRPAGVSLADAEAGGSYLFEHLGGPLVIELAGATDASATVDLFAPNERVAGWPLGPTTERPRKAEMTLPAGAYVLHVRSLSNGTLALQSAAAAVDTVHLLSSHVERIILHQNPREGLGLPPEIRLAPRPIDAEVTIRLERPPTSLRLLATADMDDLDVTVSGGLGLVLQADDAWVAGPSSLFFDERWLVEIPVRLWPENIVGKNYTAGLEARHSGGAIVLEATSFSLALPEASPVEQQVPSMAFLYGELEPRVPTSFQVSRANDQLILSPFPGGLPEEWTDVPHATNVSDEAEPSWVALYGPDDHKIGTYSIGADPVAVSLPEAGTYVLVLLEGQAFVGLSRIPSDFQMHALANRTIVLPAVPAGSNGDYGLRRDTVELDGVAYAVRAHRVAATPTLVALYGNCWDSSVRIVQDNQTVGHADMRKGQIDTAGLSQASQRLMPGPLEVISDGFGRGSQCHLGLEIQVYQRP